MRRTKNIVRVLSLLLVSAAVAAAALGLLATRRATRAEMLATTAAQIHRGNYFAWAQTEHWMDRLTPDEQHTLCAACRQYARASSMLYASGNPWPPRPAAQPSSLFRLPQARSGLNYEVICYPATHQIPVERFARLLEHGDQ